MDEKLTPIGGNNRGRVQAATGTSYDRPPSWVILLGALLVAVGVLGRQHPAPILANSDRVTGVVERREQSQTPSQVPGRGWKDVLQGAYHGISEDRIFLVAAGVTFYAILALFPGIAAIVSIYGLFADPSRIVTHLDTLSGFAPSGAVDVLREELTRLAHQDRASLGFSFAISMGISLWSANAGVSGLFAAITAVYEEKEKRSTVKYYAITLAFTVGAVVLVLLSLAILIALPLVLDHIADPSMPPLLLKIIRWPILFVLIALALSVIYRFGSSRIAPRWRWITWGSACAAIAWLAASALFSWYVANFGSYNKTYGSLGAIIGFMTWMWVSIIVVLVGAKLNAELERRAAPTSPPL
jgi:membrane protein